MPEDIKQMQKMMEQMFAGLNMPPGTMPPGGGLPIGGPSDNPFMSAVNQMFKDFD